MTNFQNDTSIGMLNRVRTDDPQAWIDFSIRCSEILGQWARWNGMQSADAEDLTHEALLIVLAKFRFFRHAGRGSLRAWLRAIAWRCQQKNRNRPDLIGRHQLQERCERAEHQIEELQEQFDRLQQLDLLRGCMAVVQQKVRPQTWEAFRLLAVENIPGPVVAEQLQIQVEAAYAARHRVQKLISVEFRKCRNSLSQDE